jgi:hypothetical protein
MRCAAYLSSLAGAVIVTAAMTQAAQAANLKGTAVVLRALDKVTAATQDFTVEVGENLTYGSLTVEVKHCEKRPPEDIPETYAFLQVFDKPAKAQAERKSPLNNQEPLKIFSGWMLGSSPAASALDHGVYDIWVIDCKVPTPAIDLELRSLGE